MSQEKKQVNLTMQISNSDKVNQIVDLDKTSLLMVPNKKRFRAFDLARGIAIVTMVTIHSIVFVGSSDLESTAAGYVCNSVISILAAPVFMFVMGILFIYSSRVSFKSQIYRGFSILMIGYILNLFRGTIPIAAGLSFGWVDKSENPLIYIMEDDILQFAGIAYIIMAFIKKVLPWKYSWILLGGIIAFASPVLWDRGSDQPIINYLISLFTGSENYNFFPLFPWIVFPLYGMTYGEILYNANDKQKFFNNSVFFGLLLIVIGIGNAFITQTDTWTNWYRGEFRQGKLPSGIIYIFMGFQCLWMWLCNIITQKLPENRFLNRLYFWSNNVTSFYIIQWVLIGWICIICPELEWPATIVCIVLVLFFTDYFIKFYLKIKSNLKSM